MVKEFWIKVTTPKALVIEAGVAVIVLAGLAGYFLWTGHQENVAWRGEIAALTRSLQISDQNLASTTAELIAERERNDSFESQIRGIAGTVGVLDKLANTDKELLAKYSKVYFLSENYIPKRLTPIDKQYLYEPDKTLITYIETDIWPRLKSLLAAAAGEGVVIKVASAYRSFDTQTSLKSNYSMTYGSGANRFSADQGYSEHQLGTAVDLTTELIGGSLVGFEKSEAYKWLTANAYRYGFVLSYPKGNAYYQYEPWHWRFVGVELATTLHNEGKYFYDLDQRTIDGYLVKIFD